MFSLSQFFSKSLPARFGGRSARRASVTRWSDVSCLESRALLAGVVNASFSGGTLTLTAVDDLTPIGIQGGLNDQEVLLTGAAAGVVTVAGVNGTIVNGAGVFTGVTAIKIDMKLGNDIAVLNSVSITGAATFLGGDGNNTLKFDTGFQFFGSLAVTNGDGKDSVKINTSDVTVTGAVVINNGDGEDKNEFGTSSSSDVSFGSLKVTSGNGDTTIKALAGVFTVLGTTQFTSGEGEAEIKLTPLTLTLGGALTVTNSTDSNEVAIGGSAVVATNAKAVTITNGGRAKTTLRGTYVGAVNVTNGAGRDELDLEALTVTGNVTIKNGAGGSETDFKGAVAVTGALSITNGAGNDEVGTDSGAWTSLSVTGGVTISNGNGSAVIDLSPLNSATIGGNLSLTNGIGDTDIDFQTTNTFTVSGSTTVTSGEGDDEVAFGNSSANSFKAVTLSLGTGDSSVRIDGATTIDGNLSLSAGSGAHDFNIIRPFVTKNATFNLPGDFTKIQVSDIWTVNGNLSVTTTSGDDNFVFAEPMTVSGTTTISTGSGDDFVQLIDSIDLNGAVSITTGAGEDRLQFFDSLVVFGNLLVDTGSAGDKIEIDNSRFKGTVSLTMGSGADTLQIENGNNTVRSLFEKAVTINMDAGDDVVNIGLVNDPNDFVEFQSTLTIKGGAGLDIVRFKNAALGGNRFNTFAVAPAVTLFELQE